MKTKRFLGIAICVALVGAACTKKEPMTSSTDTSVAASSVGGAGVPAVPAGSSAEQTLAGGLKIQDIKMGSGAEATSGKNITVHYTGMLTDGKKFDSSLDHGQPFKFLLGGGQVIKGWDQGFAGMKVGGKRRLTIPSDLGYGERGAGAAIPPNATLVFDVELLGVE